MYPQIQVHGVAIAIATLVAFFFSYLWYGPLFGKTWATWMGMSFDKKPESKEMLRSMVLGALGTFLMAYVLDHTTQVWRHSVWGGSLESDGPLYLYGVYSGFFTWLGFYVPRHLNSVAWERRTWKLAGLNAAHDFLHLQIIAVIVGTGCCS